MACCGNRRKSRSHQKKKHKSPKHSRKFNGAQRKQMHADNVARAKAELQKYGLWKPKMANT